MDMLNSCVSSAFIKLIRLYRYAISLFFGPSCRFEPSCSQYAIEAIAQQGCSKGSYLIIKRLLKCHPWHPGGYDPVCELKKISL